VKTPVMKVADPEDANSQAAGRDGTAMRQSREEHDGHQAPRDCEAEVDSQPLIQVFVLFDVVEQLRPQDANEHFEADQRHRGQAEEGDVDASVQPLIARAEGGERGQQHQRDGDDRYLRNQDD